MILTYKQAAQKLNVSLGTFEKYIVRPEFRDYRTQTLTVLKNPKTKNKNKTVKRRCRGVIYSTEFAHIFKKLLRGYYALVH